MHRSRLTPLPLVVGTRFRFSSELSVAWSEEIYEKSAAIQQKKCTHQQTMGSLDGVFGGKIEK